jgi:hypothetical protein
MAGTLGIRRRHNNTLCYIAARYHFIMIDNSKEEKQRGGEKWWTYVEMGLGIAASEPEWGRCHQLRNASYYRAPWRNSFNNG